MFTSNPWGAYITMLAPLLAGYYLFVGLRFYGPDLKARIAAGRSAGLSPLDSPRQDFDTPDPPAVSSSISPVMTGPIQQGNSQTAADEDTEHMPTWQNEELFDQLELLAGHLKEAIEEAHEKDYGKQDLVLLLQMTLKEYPAMHDRPFRTAIENLIGTECSKYGSIHLREQDLAAVWKQVV